MIDAPCLLRPVQGRKAIRSSPGSVPAASQMKQAPTNASACAIGTKICGLGGDGIVPWATDRALIEHNIALYCNHRAGSFNAGIWPWSTDNSIFQLNEAAFTQTTKDGEGFDSDYNSRNT